MTDSIQRRITLRDIAAKTGFHYSTISLALRGDSRLSADTREKVLHAAQEMGYCPDPLVQALAVYRHAIRPASYRATLAWLVNDDQSAFQPGYNFTPYLVGAQRRAGELGYKLEEFLLRAPGMSPAQMTRILENRGIVGILIPPQPSARMRARIRMNWAPFAAVSFGYTLAFPSFHRVTNHHFRAAKLCVRKLFSLGYRRIGLCLHRVWNGRVDGAWVGGYFSEMSGGRLMCRIEPLLVEGWDKTRIRRWILKNRLDAVIVDESQFIDLISESLQIPVPQKLGAACLQIAEQDRVHSGIFQNEEDTGRAAIDLLVHLLNTQERGIPLIIQNILVEGIWREGASTRKVYATGGKGRKNPLVSTI
jgi:LacI family transcriptional regulator